MRCEQYKGQNIIADVLGFAYIEQILDTRERKDVLVVCSASARKRYSMEFSEKFDGNVTFFHEFSSNPKYEEVVEGVRLFREKGCDAIISLGGGSAIDVAKCIKAFSDMSPEQNYLKQKIKDNGVCHIAIPTTAGTGSESTSFAVIYYEGEKQSVADVVLLPDYAVLCPQFLESLPVYQKKATLLDALCQGIESYWSVNATEESREYARKAVSGILLHMWQYLEGAGGFEAIMEAANYAGRAINISKTTAAHAMSYKITSMYGYAHGHAVALCLPVTWEFMNGHMERACVGSDTLRDNLQELAQLMQCRDSAEAVTFFENMLQRMDMEYPVRQTEEDVGKLAESVNVERLNNFPIPVEKEELMEMYEKIVR